MGPLGRHVLLLALGVALLSAAITVGGPETDTIYGYTAYEVSYDENLTLRNVQTGENLSSFESAFVNVDEDLVCFPVSTRACKERAMDLEEGRPPSDRRGGYEYAYLNGSFHHITRDEYERTSAPVALADLASDSDVMTDEGRRAISRGSVLTTWPLAGSNELVQHDGRLYTVLLTGTKQYGSWGPPLSQSSCASGGDGFCGRAEAYYWQIWLYQGGLAIGGVIGTIVGGVGLVRRRRELRAYILETDVIPTWQREE